jgi:hypothetical protein
MARAIEAAPSSATHLDRVDAVGTENLSVQSTCWVLEASRHRPRAPEEEITFSRWRHRVSVDQRGDLVS